MEKKNKILTIILIICVIVILGLSGYLIYDNIIKKENNKIVERYKGLTEEDTSKYKNVWKCDLSEYECEDLSNITNLKIEGNKIEVYSHSERYLLYKDNNKIKLYDSKEDKNYIAKIDSGYIHYNLIYDNETEDIFGIVYTTSSSYDALHSYYSIVSDEVIYKDNYTSIEYLGNGYLKAFKYNEFNDLVTAYILDINENKILLSEEDNSLDEHQARYSSYANNNYIVLYDLCQATCIDEYLAVYTLDLKEISRGFDSITYDDNNNLIVLKNGKTTTYNKNGDIISESNKSGKILDIVSDYVIYLDNNKIKLLKDNKEIATICDFDLNTDEFRTSYTDIYEDEITISFWSDKITVDEAWDYFSNMSWTSITKEDLKESYFAYVYHYNINTKKISRDIITDFEL